MMEISILYIILVIILSLLFPLSGIIEGPKIKALLIKQPEALIGVLKQTILFQIVLTFFVLISMFINKDGISVIGLDFISNIGLVALLLVLSLLFLYVIYKSKIPANKISSLKKEYEEVNYILPKNEPEFKWAITLSFAVGTMEEILYRGFLFWQLSLYLPLLFAVLLTNIIFALLHFGTGMKNAIMTFILGMIYSAISIPFETLWFAILAHILTDLYAVTMGYKLNQLPDSE